MTLFAFAFYYGIIVITFLKITPSFLVKIWSSRYQIKDTLKIYNLK